MQEVGNTMNTHVFRGLIPLIVLAVFVLVLIFILGAVIVAA